MRFGGEPVYVYGRDGRAALELSVEEDEVTVRILGLRPGAVVSLGALTAAVRELAED